jgi:hypothetical protein
MKSVLLAIFLVSTGAWAADYGAGFTQKMVPVEGCTLSTTVGGKGPTVLLLHGYAESARMWKPLAVQLAKLPMPVSTIGGAKANGDALGAQAKFISANPTVVILKDAGHWILD